MTQAASCEDYGLHNKLSFYPGIESLVPSGFMAESVYAIW